MKSKVLVSLLAVVALGLVIALFATRRTVTDQQTNIASLSNQVNSVTKSLGEMTSVNQTLEADLAKRNTQYLSLTNMYSDALTTLAKTEKDLKQSEDSLKLTKDELAASEARINKLENQNKELDAKSVELSGAITTLTAQIEDTQKKLASAEGDKDLLQKELTRLLAEKADLERKLSDLQFLKTQVAQLKAELSISRRLEWIRKGLFASDQKGATALLQASAKPAPAPNNYDLNVEINADGSVKVIPPATNAPAAK
jgi:chromosome segregation ATPase